jgi:hypothetical protein
MRKFFSIALATLTYTCLLALVITGVARAGIEAKEHKSRSLTRSQDEF